MEKGSTYRQIFRATSIFGSVQVFSVLVSVIRYKLISYWIGAAGMGIAGLLTATVNIISGISNLGIEVSAVRHISSQYDRQNPESLSVPVSVTRKLAIYTGLAGTFLCLLFSKWLSVLTFGDESFMWAFVVLSVTLLFKQVSTGELVVLQSLRRIRHLARANFYGSLVGLVISAPLYYIFRLDAIVPAMVISTLAMTVFSFVFSHRVKIKKAEVSRESFVAESRAILKLGMISTLSGVLLLVSSWAIQVYISNVDSHAMVGYYNAGFTLLNSYVGLIFTAMGTDYYPRLSAIASDNLRMRDVVREQSFVGVLIITPIIVFFMAFADVITKVLFTSDFLLISTLVIFGMFGMLFRTVSFSMGYMVLAKADTKLYTKTAIGFNFLYFVLSIAGYHYRGLAGLGMAFALHYFLHFGLLLLISNRRYQFSFDKEFALVFAACIAISLIALIFALNTQSVLRTIVLLSLIIVSALFSLYFIHKKVDLLSAVQNLNNRKHE